MSRAARAGEVRQALAVVPAAGRRGRGATANPAGRFESFDVEPFDDGWGTIDLPPERLKTEVRDERARTIIARNDSPDIPFDRSINPYRGCEHGCVYCFARPSHAFLGLSAGLDFETKLVAKPNAADALRREIAKPGYVCATLALGTNTDPYQPVERTRTITRSILELLVETRHPFSIVTKSNLVLRDLELIREAAARGLTRVYLSVTTLDRTLARAMEPRAPTPARRIEAIRAFADAGVPVGVLASPMIPAINDVELESILEAAKDAGATSANYILVRLPFDVRPLFEAWLDEHYPERKAKVLAQIRSLRGGALNDPRFGSRMRGDGPYAELLRNRFRVACDRLELAPRSDALDTSQFVAPAAPGRPRRAAAGQRSLF